MEKQKYVAPQMEAVSLALRNQVLAGSGQVEMSLPTDLIDLGGYNAPLNDYDKIWD